LPDSGGPFFIGPASRVRFHLRLTPKASRNALSGVVEDAEGKQAVKAGVTAVPEKGKANAALIKMLAKEWKLPKSAFALVAGETDRRKTLEIDHGDPVALLQQLTEWMERQA